jgi:bacterial leucyl aminopeptidase
MDSQLAPVAFFDIGDTLGSARLSPRPPHRLERLDIYPQVPDVLQELRENGVRLGIVSNIGQEPEENVRRVLEEGQIYDFFDSRVLIYGAKDSPEIFRHAAEQAGHSTTPERCLYVGENREERGYALEAGFRVAPHSRLALEVSKGSRLRYIRVTVPVGHRDSDRWREEILSRPVVPIDVTGENGTTLYAIATSDAASQLDDLGFEVLRLGSEDLPLATEVYFLRDERQTRTGFLVEEGESRGFFDRDEESQMVLASSEGGLYVALPADRSVLQYHFEEVVHGHILKLTPGMGLVEPSEVNRTAQRANLLSSPLAAAALGQEEIETFRREITPESVAADVDRYSGERPIDSAGRVTIQSRHVEHEHNAQAVAALAQDLEGIGGDAFSVGLYQFDEIMREPGRGPGGSFRKTLNNVEAELAGNESQETVLVTAHLDSTACDPGPFPCRDYDATNEPAPGADDDGSGIAGVLAAARAIKRLSAAKRPKRTIRFVLFNAEEVGLVGSREYAQDQAALGKPIAAVYQMDMMGYNKEAPRTYEIHAGADREGVQDGSLVLAQRIEGLAQQVSSDLPSPQIHLNKGLAEADKDPAYRRSDHHSFHLVGYAACAATEDFFHVPLVPGEPVASEGNPNYHTARDTFVDPEYAADIARAVAAAAWATANL